MLNIQKQRAENHTTLISTYAWIQPRRRRAAELPKLFAAIYTSSSVDLTATTCPHWKPLELSAPSPGIPKPDKPDSI